MGSYNAFDCNALSDNSLPGYESGPQTLTFHAPDVHLADRRPSKTSNVCEAPSIVLVSFVLSNAEKLTGLA
jgi:hypothetical protein